MEQRIKSSSSWKVSRQVQQLGYSYGFGYEPFRCLVASVVEEVRDGLELHQRKGLPAESQDSRDISKSICYFTACFQIFVNILSSITLNLHFDLVVLIYCTNKREESSMCLQHFWTGSICLVLRLQSVEIMLCSGKLLCSSTVQKWLVLIPTKICLVVKS